MYAFELVGASYFFQSRQFCVYHRSTLARPDGPTSLTSNSSVIRFVLTRRMSGMAALAERVSAAGFFGLAGVTTSGGGAMAVSRDKPFASTLAAFASGSAGCDALTVVIGCAFSGWGMAAAGRLVGKAAGADAEALAGVVTIGTIDCGIPADACTMAGSGGGGTESGGPDGTVAAGRAATVPPAGAIRAAIGSAADREATCWSICGDQTLLIGTVGVALNPLGVGTDIDDLASAVFFSPWPVLPGGEIQPPRPASSSMLPAIRFITSPPTCRSRLAPSTGRRPEVDCEYRPKPDPLLSPELPKTGIPRCYATMPPRGLTPRPAHPRRTRMLPPESLRGAGA